MTDSSPPRDARLVVAGSFTTEPVASGLDFWIRRLGWDLDVHFSPYGQLFQELLTPGSTLRDGGSVRALLVSWDDLTSQSAVDSEAWLQEAQGVGQDLLDALTSAIHATAGVWIVVLAKSARSVVDRTEVEAAVGAMDREFARSAAELPGLVVLESAWLDRVYPVSQWRDAEADRAGHVPYTESYFAALATSIARGVYRLTSSPRKVLVLDCDNTLWGGVVAEDGPEGVSLDHPYTALQSSAVRLAGEGKLVCLASKNQEHDVRSVFHERGEDMVLGWEDVVAHRVNWESKVENLVSMAEELNLGLDSFVFVDDNALECAAVEAALPEVFTIRLPTDSEAAARTLDHVWPLDSHRVTDEDRARVQMYKTSAIRERARKSAGSLDAFLSTLELDVSVVEVTVSDVARASQLTQRTNQFNSTTVRRSEAEIRSFLDDPTRLCLRAAVSDRFGDYGTVGLATGRLHDEHLEVDGFMLSCRALARGVEYAMVRAVGEAARVGGLDRTTFRFEPSERNEPIARFFTQLSEDAGLKWTGDGPLTLPTAFIADVRPPRLLEGQITPARRDVRVRSDAVQISSVMVDTHRLSDVSSIHQAVLADLEAGRPDLANPFAPPRTELERLVAGVWCDVLHLDRVGVEDRFSDLGGSSLDLVRILGRLSRETRRALDITDLLQHATVRSLAAHLDETSRSLRSNGARDRAERQRRAMAAAGRRASDRRKREP